MKTALAVGLSLAALTTVMIMTTWSETEMEPNFADFVAQYRRSYFSRDEYNHRREVFRQNVDKINKMNADPEDTATYGVNEFSDWTEGEFSSILTVPEVDDIPEIEDAEPFELDLDMTVPNTFSWMGKGVVNPIKDQKYCGSCWAFAAVASLESAWAIKTGSLLKLSEQELVDCSRPYGNYACDGGHSF